MKKKFDAFIMNTIILIIKTTFFLGHVGEQGSVYIHNGIELRNI